MPSLPSFANEHIEITKQSNRLRVLKDSERQAGVEVVRDGKRLISFSCNDYFGLSQHPEVINAAQEATARYGTSAAASRLVTGNHPLYQQFESHLARHKQQEAALVVGSGYLANIGVIPALVDSKDLIIADKLIHACMVDGAQLSGASLHRFSHNNLERCEALLQKHRHQHRHCLMLTETVFSMDGDRAPMAELLQLAERYDAWLLADDAHGLGIVPPVVHENYIQIGTLSKGLGSYGGYVTGSQAVIDYLVTSARSVIFSTGLPPAVVAAADAALALLTPERVNAALDNARMFTSLAKLPEAQSTIVPWIIGEEKAALAAAQQLEEAGFLVSAIRPPTVPPGTARLRFTFSALHTQEDVERVVEQIQCCHLPIKLACDKA